MHFLCNSLIFNGGIFEDFGVFWVKICYKAEKGPLWIRSRTRII